VASAVNDVVFRPVTALSLINET